MQDLDDYTDVIGSVESGTETEYVCFYSEQGTTTHMVAPCKEEHQQ